ncbi:glutathione S-transferase family protein [Chondromyces crocatus]|uniref:Glutathione S-transferase n=1 Tax=Chondromyces crocatus TaxID=52 RepID=A0A0K1ER19_CHOCO|nr:glutathione S-transferase family protein [Chondromyces crocatus]AKT43291.1 glutathione S-transferase [Chondromyces crocatus]
MGFLVKGEWRDQWYDTKKTGGAFKRKESQFRNWITPDGSPGPTGKGGFRAEPGRYHLYIARACPWAHRTTLFRALKGLDDMIGLSVVHWLMAEEGWTFEPGEGVVPDDVNGVTRLYQLYTKADPEYSGSVTVPVLWDKQRNTIVSNESAEIIRMLNSAFDGCGARAGDYYPRPLRTEIDALNDRIYDRVNNGVYKAGFATEQEAYEAAVGPLFETLDELETRLTDRRFLFGASPTEADFRLFTTLLRFDPVYHGHFKCNVRRLVDYPALWAYTRDLYQWPGVKPTVNFTHIKRHYYMSHTTINPHRIVPVGPALDFDAPHGRAQLSEA